MVRFATPGFLTGAVIYEVNIRQYTPEGTFRSFQAHLPRLKQMGVDILWFMPIHPIGVLHRKGSLGSYYSIRDHKAVNPEFGSDQDFRDLVQACHQWGFKVMLDWVANHVSWDSAWAKNRPDFIRSSNGMFVSPFDWTDVLQIEHQHPAQQEAMIDNMAYWIHHFDIDGFRADLPHLVPLDFWIKARTKLDSLKPSLIWLGETEEENYTQVFDITFTWKWMHATETVLKHTADISTLTQCLRQDPLKGYRLYFTSNHDENSWNGTEFEKYGVYAMALAVFSALYPGSVPLVYSGQEIPNHIRLPFFDKAQLHWNQVLLMESFYTTLFRIRHTYAYFFAPETPVEFIDLNGIWGYQVFAGQERLMVYLNLSSTTQALDVGNGARQHITALMQDRCDSISPESCMLLPGGFWVGVQ